MMLSLMNDRGEKPSGGGQPLDFSLLPVGGYHFFAGWGDPLDPHGSNWVLGSTCLVSWGDCTRVYVKFSKNTIGSSLLTPSRYSSLCSYIRAN